MKLRELCLAFMALPLTACVEEVPDRAEDADTIGAMEEAVLQTEGQRPPGPVPEGVDLPGEDISVEATRARRALRERYEALSARFEALEPRLLRERPEEVRELREQLEEARSLLFYVEKQLGRVWEEPRQELTDTLDDIEGDLDELSAPPG